MNFGKEVGQEALHALKSLQSSAIYLRHKVSILGHFSGASAALASERARLRDRLIRMEYLAGESNLSPEDKKFIRRRGYCRRSRRYTEKREGRRESELLKALGKNY